MRTLRLLNKKIITTSSFPSDEILKVIVNLAQTLLLCKASTSSQIKCRYKITSFRTGRGLTPIDNKLLFICKNKNMIRRYISIVIRVQLGNFVVRPHLSKTKPGVVVSTLFPRDILCESTSFCYNENIPGTRYLGNGFDVLCNVLCNHQQ